MLTGLDNSYDAFVTSINLKGDGMTVDEFYSHLLDNEAYRETSNTSYQISVNMAGRGNGGGGRGRGRGGGGRGGGPQGGGRGQGGGQSGGSSGSGSSGGNKRNNGDRPVCQLCNKVGHVAFRCYNRFNHNFQPEESRVVSNISAGQQGFDGPWYMDSGATDHITGNLDKLHLSEQYSGKDQVHTASGAGTGFEEGSSSRTQ